MLDVTDRIIGKLEKGGIALYLEQEKIGVITLPESMEIDLEHHYEAKAQKIYQHVSVPSESQPRYTDCDEGGWC